MHVNFNTSASLEGISVKGTVLAWQVPDRTPLTRHHHGQHHLQPSRIIFIVLFVTQYALYFVTIQFYYLLDVRFCGVYINLKSQ